MQRRIVPNVFVVLRVWVRPILHQRLNDGRVLSFDCIVQRRLPVYVRAVHVDLVFGQKGYHVVNVAMVDRVEHQVIPDALYRTYHLASLLVGSLVVLIS